MRIEMVFDSYDIGMWFRSRWTRLLIRLHLRKPYDGPNYTQMFGALDFSYKLYELSPSEVPFLAPWEGGNYSWDGAVFTKSPLLLLDEKSNDDDDD